MKQGGESITERGIHVAEGMGTVLMLPVLFFTFTFSAFGGNERNVDQKTTIVDEAKIKELELVEKIYNDQRAAEEARLATMRALEERRREKARIAEEEQQKAARVAEKERRDSTRRALDAEVSRMASSSNRFEVLVAELRSRQGRLQLKLNTLPADIAEAEKDFSALDAIMAGCMQSAVTNVRQQAGIFVNMPAPVETVVEQKPLPPDEYINTLKSHSGLKAILSKYNSRMINRSLDMIAENFVYETERLKQEMNEVRSGKGNFSTAQRGAVSHNKKILDELRGKLRVVEGQISNREQSIRRFEHQGRLTSEQMSEREEIKRQLVPLYKDKEDLDSKIGIAEAQSKYGRASEIGVIGSFRSQEVSIRNEYEANLRESIGDARNIVLSVVETSRQERMKELEQAKEEFAAIQIILDAHAKGALTADQKATLLGSVDAKQSRDLSGAASVLWSDK